MSRKTTVYLSDHVKQDPAREASSRGCSEAQVIREAIAAAVTGARPRSGIIAADPIAEQSTELLDRFGDR